MSSLLRVEFLRLRSRRLARVLGGLVVLGILIGGTTLFVKSHRLGPGEASVFRAKAQAKQAGEIAACARGEFGISQDQVPPGQTLGQFCAETVVPLQVPDPAFHLTQVREVLLGFLGPLLMMLFVIGASFAGAEWHAGTIATMLVWEPRRVRVFAAKALTVALFAFVAALLAQALLAGAISPAAVWRGSTAGAHGAWLRSTLGLAIRGATVGGLVAVIGMTVASLGRNTAAALGGAFLYVAVLEPLLRALRPKWQPWLLYDNVVTFVQGHAADFTQYGRSLLGASLVMCLYVVGLLALAGLVFQRRDVT